MSIKRIFNLLPKEQLGQNITVLAGSTIFSQGVFVLITPILTRLYNPADFGVLAIFTFVSSFFLIFATLRYEWAIPNLEKDSDVIYLLIICLIISIFASAISIPVLILIWKSFNISAVQTISPYFWIVPFYIFFWGVYQSLYLWAIREKSFIHIAKTRIIQGILGALTNIFLGLISLGPLGLIVGNVVFQTSGFNTLAKLLWSNKKNIFEGFEMRKVKYWFRYYFKFAISSTLSGVVNTISLQIVVFLLAFYFDQKVVGYYYLAQRIIGLPTMLIGQSVSQVFWAEAAQLAKENPIELKRLFFRFSKKLALYSTAILFLGIISPFVLVSFLGSKEWEKVGNYVLYLVPASISQLISGSISNLAVHELQHWQLVWDIFRTVFIVLCFCMAHKLDLSPDFTIFSYSLVMSFAYFVLYIINIQAINIRLKKYTDKI
jgi:O-antigen/teichoic acid export membrane protein